MSPREAGARRRRGLRAYCAAVLAWTVAFMTALVLLPPGAHTTAVAHADTSQVTVKGPPVWKPATQTSGANGSVTVSQTQNVVDQMVHVSWTGFTPSVTASGASIFVGGGNGWEYDLYPVVVYECRGTTPKITDCYGSYHYGQSSTGDSDGFEQMAVATGLNAPDFPNNEQAAITDADGSGSADIELYTANQSPSLGCDATHQCSIVVEPNYGGDPLGFNTADGSPNCTGPFAHAADTGGAGEAADPTFGSIDGLGFQGGEQCAWQERTVIPISFAPVPGACAAGQTKVAAEGEPMLDRALTQWVVGACLAGNDPMSVGYASDLTEPQARADFLAGGAGADVAFTSLPADPAASSTRPYTYVPVGSNGIAVTFAIDDPNTQLPIRSLRLDARLLAKMLTQSYDLEAFHGQLSDTASVAGNPVCLFADPEFQALNPADGFSWPTCNEVGATTTLPVVMGGKTDLVRQLTTWIMSDPDARSFLAGSPDPWGMHVDDYYKASVYPYPLDSFIGQDSSGPPNEPTTGGPYDPHGTHRDFPHLKGFEWNPLQSGLDDVLRHQLTATATCVDPTYDANTPGGHAKCGPQNLGARGLIAIMDTGRAAAFNLPTAALRNAAGAYVTAGVPGMAAAAADYATDPKTHTQSLQWGAAGTAYAKDAGAYPLTVPAYAMAPVAGVPAAKANGIADFLALVTDGGRGQFAGTAPGQLAPGYVADSAAQAAQAGAAIAAIRPHPAGGGGATTTVTATGPVPTGGTTGVPTTSGNTVKTPVTVTTNGTASVYTLTSTLGGGAGTGGSSGSSSKAGAAGPVSSGPVRSLNGSTTPAAAVGTPAPDQAGLNRFVLPTLLVIGLVLVVLGPVGLMLSTPGGVGARVRGLRSGTQPTRRFGK
jgi:hypothetical protein